MWNALRADLTEFVSTVTEDTSNVLSKLDAGMEEGSNDGSFDNEGNAGDGTQKRKVNHAELNEIMKLLRGHPGTYTEPISDEDDKEAVEEFLKNFSIEAKTDEIAEVLNQHEDTVKQLFEELCPTQVSYEDFWKRYFYRCDEDRIAKQLQEETERARKARAAAIEGGIKSVTNFFGGAFNTVTSTIAPEETGETPTSDQNLNFFGAKGRPPFVMNTAVSESGGEEEDEEEELGWDDDDDDDLDLEDEDDNGSKNESRSEQIEFTDKVAEDLREQLKQAIEERDQIQQTVQMQANEIKILQNKLSENPSKEIESEEVDLLKLKLFEKDSELVALKAKVHDDGIDEGDNKFDYLAREIGNLPADQKEKLKSQIFGSTDDKAAQEISALEEKVQELNEVLKTKDASLLATHEKLEAKTKELEATQSQLSNDRSNAQNEGSALKSLEDKLKATQESLEAVQAVNAQLKQDAQAAQESSTSELSDLQKDLAASQDKIASLTKQLQEATQRSKTSEDALQKKETELAESAQKLKACEDALQKKEEEVAAAMTAASTGGSPVKVTTPSLPSTPITPFQAARLDDEDEEVEDDWGDDWD